MSLQARVRPSVQTELDLHTTVDRCEERDRKKENFVFVPLNVFLIRDSLQSFFFSGFTEVVCAYFHYRSVRGCVLYYCLSYSIHTGYITRCVCFTIICSIIYMQTKLLQCYYRDLVYADLAHPELMS